MRTSRFSSGAFSSVLLAAGALLLTACAADARDPSAFDGALTIETVTGALTPADATYFAVTRRDTRRCASPLCGGYFVKAVNAELVSGKHAGQTRCVDGTWQKDCYVGAIEYTSFGANGRSQAAFADAFTGGAALVRGDLHVKVPSGVTVAKLVAREAWKARSSAPAAGPVATLTLSDVACQSASCVRGARDLVNDTAGPTKINAIEWARALGVDDQAAAEAAAHEAGRGLLVAGNVTKSHGASTLTVTHFYTRADAGVGGVGDVCGTRGASPCDASLYCAFPAGTHCGAADQGGTCAAPSARICTEQYQPVCGCDGNTYGNACTAARAGVSVDSDGECAPPVAQLGESCGGNRRGAAMSCAAGLFCDYTLDAICGIADASGTCKSVPDVCTREYAPVCGCDGKTYSTACVANAAGTAVLAKGACAPQPAN